MAEQFRKTRTLVGWLIRCTRCGMHEHFPLHASAEIFRGWKSGHEKCEAR